MSRYREAALFLLMASFWALNYVFLKVALVYQGPLYILSVRIGVAAIFSLILFGGKVEWSRNLRLHLTIFMFSMLNLVIFMAFWFTGEETVSAGLSAIVVYTFPLFNVLFSRIFLRETLTLKIMSGLVVGFLGMVITFSGSVLEGDTSGILLLAAGAISWAAGTTFYKKYLSTENTWTVNTLQYFYALPVILVLAFLTEPFSISGFLNYHFFLIAIYMGSLGTGAAYFIYLYLFRHYKASSISSFFFSVPALSLAFSFLILGQTQSPIIMVGFAIISVGIYLGSGSVEKEE